MNEIRSSRFRPISVFIFLLWFLVNPTELVIDPRDGNHIPELFLVILLVLALVFKIREQISISNGYLVFNLHKQKAEVKIKAINNLNFKDTYNQVEIETNDALLLIDIKQFHGHDVAKFFINNKLYSDDLTEQKVNNITSH